MAIELATAYVNVVPSAKGFGKDLTRQLTGSNGEASRAGRAAGKSVAIGLGAGIALAGKGLFAAIDFDEQMREVFTLMPQITDDAMSGMTESVKSFAKEFGVLPSNVVPALYQSISAGVPKDNVFAFLETAQKAAKGGVTDLTVAVDGISSVTNAYGVDVMSATKASDLMFTAVRLGKTNFEELSSSLFNVTPTASALGVQFGDVTAAIATMTAQGVPTKIATTQMRQLFVELSKSTSTTAKTFESLSGKSFKQFIAEGGNTQEALQLLEQHATDSGLTIADMFGSVEAGAAALALTGGNTESYAAALDEMAGSAGATNAAFDTMNGGLRPVIDKLKVFGQIALIWIGDKAIPVVERLAATVKRNWPQISRVTRNVIKTIKTLGRNVADWIGRKIVPHVNRFAQLVRDNWPLIQRIAIRVADGIRELFRILGRVGEWMNRNRATVATFVAVLAGLMIISSITKAVAAFNIVLAANPAVLIAIGIAALAAGLVYAYQNVESFRNIVDTTMNFAKEAFQWVIDKAQQLWTKAEGLRKFLMGAFKSAVSGTVTAFGKTSSAVGTLIGWFKTAWDKTELLRTLLVGAFKSAVSGTVTAFGKTSSAVGTLIGWFKTAWDKTELLRTLYVGAFKTGIGVARTGIDLTWAAVSTLADWLQKAWDKTEPLRVLFAGGFNTAVHGIKSAFRFTWSAVKTLADWLQKAWDKAEPLRVLFAGGFKTAIDGAKGVFKGLWEMVQNVVGGLQSVIDKAKSAIEWVNKINPFSDKAVSFDVDAIINAAGKPKRKDGGTAFRQQAYMTGEAGRELFIPATDGFIIPNDLTEQLVGGSSRELHLHNHGRDMSPSDAAFAFRLAEMAA